MQWQQLPSTMEIPGKLAALILVITNLTIAVRCEFVGHALKKFYVERHLKFNWYQAWDFCRENNMTLISIDTSLEQRLLEPLLGKHFDFWTSGNENAQPSNNKFNRAFVWASTGRAIQYTNWLKNEPNNHEGKEHCLNVWHGNFKWNDAPCYDTYGFICQF